MLPNYTRYWGLRGVFRTLLGDSWSDISIYSALQYVFRRMSLGESSRFTDLPRCRGTIVQPEPALNLANSASDLENYCSYFFRHYFLHTDIAGMRVFSFLTDFRFLGLLGLFL